MPRNFEGEFYRMPTSYTNEESAQNLVISTLGPGNVGTIGPRSESEASQASDLGRPEYQAPPAPESHCMDDRLEIYGIQLAGNRAVTEGACVYLDPLAEKLPLSENLAGIVEELNAKGAKPFFHVGCAALLVLSNRQALEFMIEAEQRPLLMGLADTRLRLLGIDSRTPDNFDSAFNTAAESLAAEKLWDANADKLLAIAQQHGAGLDPIAGQHAAVGARWDMSPNIFDNTAFRRDHKTDDGGPLGALSISLGAYFKQLETEGLTEPEVDQRLLQAVLFQLAVLKVAEQEDAPDAIVA